MKTLIGEEFYEDEPEEILFYDKKLNEDDDKNTDSEN